MELDHLAPRSPSPATEGGQLEDYASYLLRPRASQASSHRRFISASTTSISSSGKVPLVEKDLKLQVSPLPPKVFEKARKARFYSVRGDTALRKLLQNLIVFSIMLAPLLLIELLVYPAIQSVGNLPYYDCTYSTVYGFQGINMAFGEMTFTQAKLIDLVWNTIAGRCLQAALSAIAYKVLTQALMVTSEREAIPYELFCVLSISPMSGKAFWELMKATYSKFTIHTRVVVFWLLISTGYLLLFPTLIDAVSGYQARQLTLMKMANGSMLDLTHGIFSNDPNYLDTVFPRQRPSLESFNMTWERNPYPAAVFTDSNGDPIVVGWDGLGSCHGNQSCSTQSICLNSTTARLIITEPTSPIGVIDNYMDYNDSSCLDWSYLISFRLERMPSDTYFGVSWPLNMSIFRDTTNYECVSQDVYQWGFSYAWLILVASINTVWLFGTYALYLHTKYNSELVRKGRSFGIWRAILDLAESLRSDLGPHTCAYSETELEAKIKKLGPVRYRVTGRDIRHIGLVSERENGKDGEGQEQGKLRLDWDGEYGERDH